MEFDASVLKREEKAILKLRALYKKYGYTQYKMSKFEEYDLYVRNKDFLVSDNIITFTDTDGKLMALKPDVTLSIVKNAEAVGTQKLYYNENVYRVSKGAYSYKEIMQTGIECLGDIDFYCVFEVVSLAAQSLKSISDNYILDISHMGIISEVVASLGLTLTPDIIKCISEKNEHELKNICEAQNVDATKLLRLVSLYGAPDMVISELEDLLGSSNELNELKKITELLKGYDFYSHINIDFSVVNDMSYYNAIVFRGFIEGIPTGILSGGQYGSLMKKMGKNADAVGFAVYLDMLDLLPDKDKDYDVDTVILYSSDSDTVKLDEAVKMLSENGKSVFASKSVPEKLKYRQLLKLNEKGVEIINA